MTKKEKFQQLVQQIEDLGDELNDFLEEDRETNEEIDEAMFSLRMAIDQISELDIE